MELQKAVLLFLNEQRESTKKSYMYALRDFVAFTGEARPLDSISPTHVVEYHQYIRDRRHYKPASVAKYGKTIRTFFNWCVKIELLDKSPAHAFRIPKLPQPITREKAMTDEELSAILAYTSRHQPRDHALILFLADSGCRAGGASGLRHRDLDLPHWRATVTEKGDKTRLAAFGEETKNALVLWLAEKKGSGDYEYVFATRAGGTITAASISQIVTRACHHAGVRPLGSHSLRHRKGHQLADLRIAPTLASIALGHADVRTTLNHYYPKDWESAEKILHELTVGHEKITSPQVLKLPKNA